MYVHERLASEMGEYHARPEADKVLRYTNKPFDVGTFALVVVTCGYPFSLA
jgi:hypothetical protein